MLLRSSQRSRSDSGQALVEAALTLPLVLFCILGTLQMFMLLQARLMAEYAVYRAVRAGSLSHGDCKKMTEAAVLSLLPAVTATDSDAKLAQALKLRRNNRYDAGRDGGHTGQLVELWREQPKAWDVADPEDKSFDQPGHLMRLETRMVFWYRLKIPFADWVLSRMFLAQWALKPYANANPLMLANARARWNPEGAMPGNGMAWPGGPLSTSMLAWEGQGQRLFPIQVNFGMRMMTPAKKKYFAGQGCPL
jgi:hypothetical protein